MRQYLLQLGTAQPVDYFLRYGELVVTISTHDDKIGHHSALPEDSALYLLGEPGAHQVRLVLLSSHCPCAVVQN